MKLFDIKKKTNIYRTSFYITLLYIVLMIIMVSIIGENFPPILENNFKNIPVSIKSLTIISLGGITIFLISYHTLTRLQKREVDIKKASSELECQRNLIDNILDSTIAFVFIADKDFNIVETTQNIKEIIGFDQRDLMGQPLCKFIGQDKFQEMKKHLKKEETYELELAIDSKKWRKSRPIWKNQKRRDKTRIPTKLYLCIL